MLCASQTAQRRGVQCGAGTDYREVVTTRLLPIDVAIEFHDHAYDLVVCWSRCCWSCCLLVLSEYQTSLVARSSRAAPARRAPHRGRRSVVVLEQTDRLIVNVEALDPGRTSPDWKNEDKHDEKDPGYTGSLNVEGLGEHWINAWVETTKTGKKYFSIVIKPKKPRPDTSRPLKEEMSDEIPF
jgi:hypothetical protein